MACRTWANQKGASLQIRTSWDRTIHHTFHVTRQHVYLFLFNSLYLNVAYLHGYNIYSNDHKCIIIYQIFIRLHPCFNHWHPKLLSFYTLYTKESYHHHFETESRHQRISSTYTEARNSVVIYGQYVIVSAGLSKDEISQLDELSSRFARDSDLKGMYASNLSEINLSIMTEVHDKYKDNKLTHNCWSISSNHCHIPWM